MNLGLFMMFGLVVVDFMKTVFSGYKADVEIQFLLSLNGYGRKTNIPYFKSLVDDA